VLRRRLGVLGGGLGVAEPGVIAGGPLAVDLDGDAGGTGRDGQDERYDAHETSGQRSVESRAS
jgi:hypothetical protein